MTTKRVLAVGFGFLFVCMLVATLRASWVRSVFDNQTMITDVWFQATLIDAYISFTIFYLWVAWKERTLGARVAWFVLIVSLGTMAMTGYLLLQLLRLPEDADIADLLTQRHAST
ncbi:DUF1475 domain-containing protein [Stieleria sp. TO1_6]|uniref:DUF1475 family protein n=1 Tax=Stieleria tagensis TaxID=2956795 RepID=UPI00209A85A5|nr:DUF1475 family protein [Stieleria tagensis]MCO8122047.1 DUF1475 domain-containing protein [Stieleria tagensis]